MHNILEHKYVLEHYVLNPNLNPNLDPYLDSNLELIPHIFSTEWLLYSWLEILIFCI